MLNDLVRFDMSASPPILPRKQGEARRVAAAAYEFRGCVVYDAGLYPIEAIKLLRAHWQKTKGTPDHKPRMKTAGADAARTRKRKAYARKAVETRRKNQQASITLD